jgi:hypothetical protein
MNDQTASPPSAFQRHLPFLHRVLSSRRWWKALGFTALGLITLLALFYAVENWRGARAWKEVRDQLRAQGEPLSFAELVPPMPPEDENFAMTPHFRGAFDKTIDPATGKERWRLWQEQRNEQRRPRLGPLGRDLDGTWRLGERAHVVWKEWQVKEIEKELGAPINTNDLFGVLGQFVGQASADLVAIETALQSPHSQFPVRYEDNVGALLPHLSELKWLARMFTFRAHVRLAANEPTPALADILAALSLADTVKNEPILISQIVRQSMIDFTLHAIWEGLANRVWTADQIQGLQVQLTAVDVLAGYQFAMRGERTFALDLADIVERERNFATVGSANAPNYYPPSEQLRDKLINYAPKGWYLHNKAFMARQHNDFSVPAVDPVNHRVHLDRMRDYDTQLEKAITSDAKLFIARLVMPAVGKAAIRAAANQAAIDLALVACALERHRLARGTYPATLAELVPDYLAAVPHDIMDGQPLRYRVEDGKFTLYSIGVNGTDDGGHAAFKEVRDGGRSWQRDEGDWVWSYPEAANR